MRTLPGPDIEMAGIITSPMKLSGIRTPEVLKFLPVLLTK
jgi:hypothetical protein